MWGAGRRNQRTEILPAAQVSCWIDLGRLTEVWVSAGYKLGTWASGVTIVAAGDGVDQIATQSRRGLFFPSRFSGTGAMSKPRSILDS